MGIVISDEWNGYSSCTFTGTIVVAGERKQSVSKRTGRYSEFVELVVQFRQKDFPDDASCYMSLRLYAQKNADLALRLRRGTQVFGLATIATDRVEQWRRDRAKMFGNCAILLPITDLVEFVSDAMDRKKYSEALEKYKPDPNAVDWSGGGEVTAKDVMF